MQETVSAVSIIGMVVSMGIAVGLPVVAFLFWQRRSGAKWYSVLIGAGTFILFAMILEQLLHTIVLRTVGTAITDHIWLYALYGGLAAGVFEETGRFVAMKLCMKKILNKENAIMYGIGHGGIEAILILGLSMLSNILTSIMINSGQLVTVLGTLDETARAAMLSQLSALWMTAPVLFFMGGIERISAFFLQIALSYLVYLAVKGKKPGFFLLAIGIHFLVDGGAVLLSQALPVLVVEALLIVFVGLLWGVIMKLWWEKGEGITEL